MNRKYMGKPVKGTFSRLLKMVLEQHLFKIIIVVILMAGATFSNVYAMSSIQNVLEASIKIKASVDLGNAADFSEVYKLVARMAIFYLLSMTLTYSQLRIMITVGQDSLLHIRTSLFDHMMNLPLSYFDTNQHGDLMSRYTNDVDATRQMISQSLPQLTISILMMLAYLTMMIVTSWFLSIITIIFTTILIYTTRKIASGSRKYFMAQQKNVGALNGYIEEMIEGQKVVKVFRREEESIKRYSELNRNVAETARISTQRSGMLIPITVNLGYLGFAISAIVGGFLVYNGLQANPITYLPQLTVPQLVVYLLFTRQFTGPINQMGQQLNFIQMALAGASRIFEVLDLEKEVDEGKVTLVNVTDTKDGIKETNEETNKWAWKQGSELVPLKGDVRFNDVTFSYVEGKTVLKDISLFAKPGQKIAFVGATGAGKTTITNLINRFYDVQEGAITFDGIDVKDIKKSSLRRSLGIVLQDTHLFQNTVRENIRYGNLNASDNDVIEAAKLANAHDFINKLPQGYDTILTDDGSNLSQGQRQLLSIARAAISNPPVLILDEATSSIDTYTEKLIGQGMDKLMEGRTVFVIAHRLSTIKNSKAIIILDNGQIIERGNHDHLIDLKGTYYQLYTGVFELE